MPVTLRFGGLERSNLEIECLKQNSLSDRHALVLPFFNQKGIYVMRSHDPVNTGS